MRRLLVLALAALLCIPALVRADEAEDKAVAEWQAIQEWVKGENPTTPETKKAFAAEYVKRLRTLIKQNPSGGAGTAAARSNLAGRFVSEQKYDEALALYEELLKSGIEQFTTDARARIVRTLILKKDLKTARTRLDAFLKELPDDANLKTLDDHLKQLESGKTGGMKVGQPAPALKGKSIKDEDVDLASSKGKVVLVDFYATISKSWKAELAGVKKLYADLHEKGFEIIGVNAGEKDPAAWKKFLEAEQIGWAQLYGEDARRILRVWGVDKVPANALVGKDGTVLAVSVRGDHMPAAVKAALEGKPIPPAPKPKKEPSDSPQGE